MIKNKSLTNYLLLTLTTLTVTACSGDGIGSAGSSEQLQLSVVNQPQIVAAVFDSIDSTTPQLPKTTTSATQESLWTALPDATSLLTPNLSDGVTKCTDTQR